jgi:hypothetical protein
VTCDLSADGKTIVCTITAIPPSSTGAKLKASAKLAGSKKVTTKTGKGKVTMKLRSSKRLKRAPKVIIKITSGKKSASKTVRAK